MKAQQVIARRPVEAAISEGNLAENPIFVLHNTDAKPAVRVGPDGKPDLSPYTRTLGISKDVVDGRDVERSITLKANPQFGYPTMFAYRLLIAVIDELRAHQFSSPVAFLSRHELGTRVGLKRPSKTDYANIVNSLEAMRTLSLQFVDTWYVKKSGRRENITCEGLISGFSFVDDRQPSLPLDGEDSDDRRGRSWVEVSRHLFESLRQNYFHGVDLHYMNALCTPLAQRLYAYLSKKDLQKQQYTEDIRLLASKLNLKKRAPSAIWDALEPKERPGRSKDTGPLGLLCKATMVDGETKPRRFLDRWVADREKHQLTVFFYDEEKHAIASQITASLASADEKARRGPARAR